MSCMRLIAASWKQSKRSDSFYCTDVESDVVGFNRVTGGSVIVSRGLRRLSPDTPLSCGVATVLLMSTSILLYNLSSFPKQ